MLPAIFVCLAMLLTLILPPLEEQRPIELHPWIYPVDKMNTDIYKGASRAPAGGDYATHTVGFGQLTSFLLCYANTG